MVAVEVVNSYGCPYGYQYQSHLKNLPNRPCASSVIKENDFIQNIIIASLVCWFMYAILDLKMYMNMEVWRVSRPCLKEHMKPSVSVPINIRKNRYLSQRSKGRRTEFED